MKILKKIDKQYTKYKQFRKKKKKNICTMNFWCTMNIWTLTISNKT